jgi:hypothetical protein
MVSGTDAWWRSVQNEQNIAVSTRNVLHLLASANDDRSIDLPGTCDDRPTGDAWLGLFESLDGGRPGNHVGGGRV